MQPVVLEPNWLEIRLSGLGFVECSGSGRVLFLKILCSLTRKLASILQVRQLLAVLFLAI